MTPLQHLLAHARLPRAELLLDPAHLSALREGESVLDRVRVKPGASVLVSFRAPTSDPAPAGPGHAVEDTGWALLVASDDKRENILRRAAKTGARVREHSLAPGPRSGKERSAHLLSGGLDSDPKLGGEIHRVLRRQPAGAPPRLLSYNPGRHAVLLLPASDEVLRVAARGLEDLLRIGACWRELGLPTLEQHRWEDRRAVLTGPRWGSADLAGITGSAGIGAHPRALSTAAQLGEVIARLHGADASVRDLPRARLGELIPCSAGAVADLLPHRAAQLERLAERLRGTLRPEEESVLLHGDLSPDQVLVTVDHEAGTAAGTGDGPLPLRVVDLDRSGLGPAAADLGAWLASTLLAGVEEQGTAFLDGYARHRGLPAPDQLRAWTARALLASSLDPLRRYHEDWLPRVERRLDLAEAVLCGAGLPGAGPVGARLAGAGAVGAGPAAAAEALVPARVEHDDRRLSVRRAWADDGHGLPLELAEETTAGSTSTHPGQPLRGARLDPASGRVTVFAPGTDPRLPALARVLAAHPEAELISHRPGKRAVVRTEDADGQARYVKIVRPGRAPRLLSAIERAAAFEGPFRLATVLAADGDTVTFAALPGRLLHTGLPLADGSWRRAWRDTLIAWSRTVERSRLEPGDGRTAAGPVLHGPEAEAAVLTTWCERAESVERAGAADRRRAVAAAHRELTRLGDPGRPSLIHRDLHDKQILWEPDEAPALLDVDTAALGDPALDAGNLRAHATWRVLQGIWSEDQAEVVREEIDRAAAHSGLRPESLAAYESATIARLACVYAFRPAWRHASRELAASLTARTSTDPVRPSATAVASPSTAAAGGAEHGARPETPPTSGPASAGDHPLPGGPAAPVERSTSR